MEKMHLPPSVSIVYDLYEVKNKMYGMAYNSVCDWSCKAVVHNGGLFTFVYSYLSQIGMSGSTHLGEAETSLFSDKLYRTSHERTYINGLSVNTHRTHAQFVLLSL